MIGMFIQIPKVKEFVTGPHIANYANPLVLMFDVFGAPYMFICYGLNYVYVILTKLYDSSISNSLDEFDLVSYKKSFMWMIIAYFLLVMPLALFVFLKKMNKLKKDERFNDYGFEKLKAW
jgi:hypothetical protein